jgi:two-component system response regulator DesR
VLPAEDTGFLRDTLVAVLDLQPDLEVVAQDAKGDAIVPEAQLHAPGCLGRAGRPDIARELHLTVGTVRNYLASAMVKLDARNRVDAVRIATEQG